MDGYWSLIIAIVLAVLSSLSSAKKKKGNTSSVDTDLENSDQPSHPLHEYEDVKEEMSGDVFSENNNNEKLERFEGEQYFGIEEPHVESAEQTETMYESLETYSSDEPETKKTDEPYTVQKPEDVDVVDVEEMKEFDLRKAMIYSVILENPYNKDVENK
jgi:hypothetical protein